MYACLQCGMQLPPRAKGGHREREYCSDRCRQSAYRANKKQIQERERIIQDIYGLPPDPQARRDEWRSKRPRLLQACKLIESERNVAQAEAQVLKDHLQMLQSLLADKEAEIVRLQMLLEGQSKRKH